MKRTNEDSTPKVKKPKKEKKKKGAWCAGCGDTWVEKKHPRTGWCCSSACAKDFYN